MQNTNKRKTPSSQSVKVMYSLQQTWSDMQVNDEIFQFMSNWHICRPISYTGFKRNMWLYVYIRNTLCDVQIRDWNRVAAQYLSSWILRRSWRAGELWRCCWLCRRRSAEWSRHRKSDTWTAGCYEAAGCLQCVAVLQSLQEVRCLQCSCSRFLHGIGRYQKRRPSSHTSAAQWLHSTIRSTSSHNASLNSEWINNKI